MGEQSFAALDQKRSANGAVEGQRLLELRLALGAAPGLDQLLSARSRVTASNVGAPIWA